MKAKQVETLNKLTAAKATASREPNQDNLKEKCVYNISSKPLTSVELFLLQKGPKFVITPNPTPIIYYTTATKLICDSLD